jgi:hypothetical protein
VAIRDFGYSLIKFHRGTNYSSLAQTFARVTDEALKHAVKKYIPPGNIYTSSVNVGQSSAPHQEEIIEGQHKVIQPNVFETTGVMQVTSGLSVHTEEAEKDEVLLCLNGQVNIHRVIEGMGSETGLPLEIMLGRKGTEETGLYCICVAAEWARSGGEILVFDGTSYGNYALDIYNPAVRKILIGSLEKASVTPDMALSVIASFGGRDSSQNIRLNPLFSFRPGMLLNFMREYSIAPSNQPANKPPAKTN